MKLKLTTTEPTGLEKARDEALSVLTTLDPIHEAVDYKRTMKHVKTLSELIAKEKRETLSPNTALMVLGNVIVALKVVNYEQTNIVNTKVIPFLMKHI